jgi:hypothetical protein
VISQWNLYERTVLGLSDFWDLDRKKEGREKGKGKRQRRTPAGLKTGATNGKDLRHNLTAKPGTHLENHL